MSRSFHSPSSRYSELDDLLNQVEQQDQTAKSIKSTNNQKHSVLNSRKSVQFSDTNTHHSPPSSYEESSSFNLDDSIELTSEKINNKLNLNKIENDDYEDDFIIDDENARYDSKRKNNTSDNRSRKKYNESNDTIRVSITSPTKSNSNLSSTFSSSNNRSPNRSTTSPSSRLSSTDTFTASSKPLAIDSTSSYKSSTSTSTISSSKPSPILDLLHFIEDQEEGIEEDEKIIRGMVSNADIGQNVTERKRLNIVNSSVAFDLVYFC